MNNRIFKQKITSWFVPAVGLLYRLNRAHGRTIAIDVLMWGKARRRADTVAKQRQSEEKRNGKVSRCPLVVDFHCKG